MNKLVCVDVHALLRTHLHTRTYTR